MTVCFAKGAHINQQLLGQFPEWFECQQNTSLPGLGQIIETNFQTHTKLEIDTYRT